MKELKKIAIEAKKEKKDFKIRLEQLTTSLETQRVTVEQLIAVKEPAVDLEKFCAD